MKLGGQEGGKFFSTLRSETCEVYAFYVGESLIMLVLTSEADPRKGFCVEGGCMNC